MANAQSTIDLIFNGVDRASEVAKKVSGSLGDLSNSAQDISQPFADMADRLSVVQAAMAALAGVIGTVAFNESAKFEASLASLQKQMDANEGSAQQYVGQLRELALRYGENGNALVESAADFKAAGYDIETSIALVKASMDLAIAGGVETARATDLMNRSLAGFDVPASEVITVAGRMGDVLNKTADITKSSFSELAEGFAALSPIAKLTGLTFEETAAILSKVIDVFGSGSEAANGLKSGFLSLVDPSKESAAAMLAVGVNYKNADGTLRSVKDTLGDLGRAFEGLTESQKLQTASIIFGKDQAAKMVAVLSDWGGAMKLSARIAAEAGGSIEKEVGGKLALAETAVKRADEAFRQLAETLGNQFRDSTAGVIGSIGDLAIAFRDVVESGRLEPLFVALREHLGGLETLFKTIAQNLPAAFDGINFNGLLSALSDLKTQAGVALEALFGPIDLSTVDGLRNAMQKIVDLVTALTQVTAGELGGLAPFLKGIRELASGFLDAEGSTQQFVGRLIGLGSGLNAAAGYFDAINTALLSFIAFGPKLAAIPATLSAISAGFSAFAASSAGLALGIAGVAAGVGVLTFELTRLSGLDQTLNDVLAPDALAGKGATLGTALYDLAESMGLVKGAVENADTPIRQVSDSLRQQVDAARETRESITAYLDAQESAAKQTHDTSAETERLVNVWRQLGYEYDVATGKISKLNDALDFKPLPDNIVTGAYLTNIEGAVAVNQALVRSYSQISGETVKATGAFAGPGEAAKKQAEQVDEAIKKSQEYQLKMEELASNERIKNIEAVVTLKTEGLKADAERVKATFSSINESIKSTGDLIGSLFGTLKDADSFTQAKIYSQIADENRRREEALQLQKKLAEAEIERIRAQAEALARGDAAIKIEAGGLEPELEAFMWAILKKIRVKANEQFREYLLGLNPVT